MTVQFRWHVRHFTERALALLFLLVVVFPQSPALAEEDEVEAEAPEVAAEDGPAALESDDAPLELSLQSLGPIVVTGRRVRELEFDVPRSMNVVDAARIFERGTRSPLDALDDQLGLWVEKRTAHTSDLVIRGLSGANLLALIDGNTLSTPWGEGGFAGDDMYGKIDPGSIERIEVVRGPSSVLYGTNALGGVVNFITKSSPFDFTDGCIELGAQSRLTLDSAPSMWTFRQEFYGATKNFRWLLGASYWDGGATRDGSGEVQRPTGGEGGFADAHLDWLVGDDTVLTFTLQYAGNDPVYRYYRPNQENRNHRLALAALLDVGDLGRRSCIADSARFRLYYQDKKDYRRWYDDITGDLTKSGVAKWGTVQLGAQFDKALGGHGLVYGLEFQSTEGESPDDEQFTETPVGGVRRKAAPDSSWSSLGVYVQDIWRVSSRLTLTGSVRVDTFRFDTDVDGAYVPPGGLDPKEDEFTDWRTAVVGGLQATYHVTDETNVFGGWTRGFRQFAPHFGVTEHGFGVVVPTRLLEPVTADQFEVGLKHQSKHFKLDAAAYYTRYLNFQNVVPGTFQGQDWYDYNENTVRDPGEDVYVTTGNGDAFVYGMELGAELNLACVSRRLFGDDLTLSGFFMWNYGRDVKNDIPLRHTHPTRGLLRLRYDDPCPRRGLWVEATAEFVRHYDRIPPSRLAHDVGYLEDPQDPASGMRRSWGLPGYSLFDLRAGINIGRHASLVVGIDNIFDRLYRPAHARWDGPGRNIYAVFEIRF